MTHPEEAKQLTEKINCRGCHGTKLVKLGEAITGPCPFCKGTGLEDAPIKAKHLSDAEIDVLIASKREDRSGFRRSVGASTYADGYSAKGKAVQKLLMAKVKQCTAEITALNQAKDFNTVKAERDKSRKFIDELSEGINSRNDRIMEVVAERDALYKLIEEDKTWYLSEMKEYSVEDVPYPTVAIESNRAVLRVAVNLRAEAQTIQATQVRGKG